jgi:pimeloyl-ACP methyl ester carboxylesterase
MSSLIPEIQILNLNGSQVSYRKMGNGRRKIFFLHGFLGSSVQIEFFRKYVDEFDLEVIGLDRPGYNLSETGKSQFSQTNNFIKGLLEHHQWQGCELIAASGGTPFLFSFVQNDPHLIQKITIVSGLGPIAFPEFGDHLPRKLKLALKVIPRVPSSLFALARPPAQEKISPSRIKFIRSFLSASPADEKAIEIPEARKILDLAVKEAFVQNGLGIQKDTRAYQTKWNIHLTDFNGPIEIWHGEEDLILSPQMARQLHKALPQSNLHLISGEGHYSLSMNHILKIIGPQSVRRTFLGDSATSQRRSHEQ